MLEDIYRDDLIGDPNDLEEIIEGDLDDPQNEDNDNEDEIAGEGNQPDPTGTPIEPKKRKVLRPQPKLNAERLKGPRGIATLENVFKDFKFHGKGYEKHDLDRVMNQMKHWAHRLYPRFQFDDCLEKIEKLGHKKPLQTYVKKIRMGLETSEEPMNLIDDDDNIDTEMFANNDLQPPVDAFDELLSQQLSEMRARQTPQPPVASQRALQQPVILTTEQKERMLRNRSMAEERRLARLKAQQDKSKNSELDNINHKQAIKGENSSVSTMECFDIPNGGEKTNCVSSEDDKIIDLDSNLSLSQMSKRDNNISHVDNVTHNMSTLKDIPDIEKVQSESSANASDEQLTIHATSMEIDVFTDEVTFPSPDNGMENMFTKPSITFRSENAPETKNVTIMEHDVNTNKTNNHTARKVVQNMENMFVKPSESIVDKNASKTTRDYISMEIDFGTGVNINPMPIENVSNVEKTCASIIDEDILEMHNVSCMEKNVSTDETDNIGSTLEDINQEEINSLSESKDRVEINHVPNL